MDKKKQIEHWKLIIYTVFRAEDAIKEKWLKQLEETKSADNETKEKVADEYVTAIAMEILEKSER